MIGHSPDARRISLDDNRAMVPGARQVFWSRCRRLTGALLLFWLVGNVLVVWFAHDLNRHELFGFPGGFWVAAQGALLVYLGLVVAYSAIVNRMERRFLGTLEPDDMASSSQFPR